MAETDVKPVQKELHKATEEEYELSESTKARLATARHTPRAKYLSHEEVKKRLLDDHRSRVYKR